MLYLTQIVSKLTPTFTRNSIVDEVEELDKLCRLVLRSLEATNKSIPNQNFVSVLAKTMERDLTTKTKVKKARNFILMFINIARSIEKQIPLIQELVGKEFDEQVSTYALSLKRVNLLQYIPVIGFTLDYMRSFASYVLALEVNAKYESSHPTYDLLPVDRQYIEKYLGAFIDSVDAITSRGDNLAKVFEKIPDVSVDPANAKIVQQTQGSRVDPLVLGVIPLPINPFYWIGTLRVNWQVERYHRMVEDLRALELKAYNLKLLNEDRNDVKVEREVNYLIEKRINPLKEKIADMEEKYNAD